MEGQQLQELLMANISSTERELFQAISYLLAKLGRIFSGVMWANSPEARQVMLG